MEDSPVRAFDTGDYRAAGAEVRRVERAMIPEYVDAIAVLNRRLAESTYDESVEIASLPDQVRGYEDIKLRRAAAYRSELANRIRELSR